MRDLSIPAGKVTPRVSFDVTAQTVTFDGQSYPENARDFYQPVLNWFRDYFADGPRNLRLSLHLLYLNTSSVSVFMALFGVLEAAAAAGAQVGIDWYYDLENETALEMGEEFEWEVKVPFALKELPGEPR